MTILYPVLVLLKLKYLKNLKNAKYDDLEDLVYRIQLTNDEIIAIFVLKYIPTKRTGYSLNPGIYEVVDFEQHVKIFFTR